MSTMEAIEPPNTIRKVDQWTEWKLEPDGRKVPIKSGFPVSVTKPENFLPFDALDGAERKGFIFTPDDDFIGIDLDGCRDPQTGEVEGWASEILAEFGGTYAEMSPSGTGFKIWAKTFRDWTHGNKSPIGGTVGGKTSAVEVYATDRYFAFTGQIVGDTETVTYREAELDWLRDKYFAKTEDEAPRQQQSKSANTGGHREQRRRSALAAMMKVSVPSDEGDSSGRIIKYARQAVRHGLTEDEAVDVIRAILAVYPPAVEWTDSDILGRVGQIDPSLFGEGFEEPSPQTDQPKQPKEWETPDDIRPAELPPFPTETLPDSLRQFATELAEETQTPVDMSAVLVLAVCGSALAKKIAIRGAASWVEPPNLYTAVVLPPSNRKSEVYRQVVKPLKDYEAELIDMNRTALAEEKLQFDTDSRRLEKLKKTAAEGKTLKDREDAMAEASTLAAAMEGKLPPKEAKLMIDDVTPEKVGDTLHHSGERIGIFTAEGCTLFEMMGGKYRGQPDLGLYLKGHPGDSHRTDRMGRPSIDLAEPLISVGVTVQESVLSDLAKQGVRGKGLFGRFLFAMPISPVGYRDIHPEPISQESAAEYSSTVVGLLGMPIPEHGLPTKLELMPDAQRVFDDFRGQLEMKLRPAGEYGHMTDWAGKLAGCVLRIAGILHMAEHGPLSYPMGIEPETILSAIAIGEWAAPHADEALSRAAVETDEASDDAIKLLSHLEGKGGQVFTKSVLRQCSRLFRRDKERFLKAVDRLESTGHLRHVDDGGPTSVEVHPEI